MTHEVLRHEHDDALRILAVHQARLAIREFAQRSRRLLEHRSALFRGLCKKYEVDPDAPDAWQQLQFNMSVQQVLPSPLTEDVVQRYLKGDCGVKGAEMRSRD
jgi:hypothetical protein